MGSTTSAPQKVKIRGVYYEGDVARQLEAISKRESAKPSETAGLFTNMRPDTLTPAQVEALERMRQARDNPTTVPEKDPYTFWEKTGLVPIALARLRPRQYYMPITDFSQYDYDQMSPEEEDLRARWLARLQDVGWQIPLTIWGTFTTAAFALPKTQRLFLMVLGGYVAIFGEWCRAYANALPQRQDLDDFIVAKEIWYIKNVEAEELGIAPRE
eukprot:PhF_6_TR17133/c0_g1_i1/m.26413